MWLPSTGSVVTGTSLGKFHGANPRWLILQCDKGLQKFYFNQIKTELGEEDLDHPLAGSHISIVRDERPKRDPWNALTGVTIPFEYEPIVHTNGKHWWLRVRSQELIEARRSMGLVATPKVPFHLTVAVQIPKETVKPVRMNSTVEKRLSLLLNMSKWFDDDVWQRLPESQELKTLEARFHK